MDEQATQGSMFPELRPEETVAGFDEAPEAPTEVLRPPGWSLVADRKGPSGWHVVRASGPLGVVITVCGREGRVVREESTFVVLCPACAGAVTV